MKKEKVHIRVTSGEQKLFHDIVDLSPYYSSELVRQCLFNHYENKKGRIKTDDLIELNYIIENLKTDTDKIEENVSLEHQQQLKIISEQIQNNFNSLYQKIEKIRTRIKKQAVKYLLDSQAGFQTLSENTYKTKQLCFLFYPEEKEQIKKRAVEENKSVSEIILHAVLSQCVSRIIYVESYPISTETAGENAAAIHKTLLNKSMEDDWNFLIQNYENIAYILSSVIIPDKQNEIRKEAKKALNK